MKQPQAIQHIRILRLRKGYEDVDLPSYATEHAAGADIRAAIDEPIDIRPGDVTAVPTNIAVELPPHMEAQLRPRSGLALRYGITLPNAPGTIDSDYRGEIKVIMANTGRETFRINRGDRIAQIVIAPVIHAQWIEVDGLPDTARGDGGFGHTGSK